MSNNTERFLLFQFTGPNGDIGLTRGRTQSEAQKYIGKDWSFVDSCRIDGAYIYSQSHPFDWLNNPPRWISPNHPFVPANRTFGNQFFH